MDRVRTVGLAVESYLRDNGADGSVAIGYDVREQSRPAAEELADVIASTGRSVLLSTQDCPTPAIAWTVSRRAIAGALMVTASHNPPGYNGVKFIPGDGAPALPEVTDDIQNRLHGANRGASDSTKEIEEVDFLQSYREHIFDLANGDLSELTVAYDAMHGSGRGVTDALLERAGATVERVRCDADPTFGGTPPEPSAEHLGPLVDAVERTEADLGIANDGDADRLAIVTPSRGFLDENLFFAALYEYCLESDSGPAVRTVSTTFLIDRVAAAHDESVVEVPVGFKWVAEAMAEHDALVGGEESGGFTVRGHVRQKDGVLVALLAAAMAAERSIDERVDALLADHGAVHQGKIGVDCPDDRKAAAIDTLAGSLPDEIAGQPVESINDADGVKALLADGSWVLVRPSGTEPKLRVYAEAADPARVEALLSAGRDLVESMV